MAGRGLDKRVTVLVFVLVLTLAAGFSVAGCGKSLGEKAAEKAIEEAAEESGQDVDVDINDGSISVSGEGTDATFQYGGKVEIPKQIPSSLVPGGAEVYFAGQMSGEEGSESYAVQFYSKTSGADMVEFFVKELTKLGYEITAKFVGDQGGESMISVGAEKDGTEIVCTGGTKADGKYSYVVQIMLGETSSSD